MAKPIVQVEVLPNGVRVRAGGEEIHLALSIEPHISVEVYTSQDSQGTLLTLMPQQILDWPTQCPTHL